MLKLLPPPPALDGQPPVACQECRTWWTVDPESLDPWRCPTCGRNAAFAVQPGTCPACGERTTVIREGHVLTRTTCFCHLTPEQLAAAEARDRKLRAQMARKLEWERAKQAQQQDLAKQRAQAEDCWEERNHHCTLPEKRLFDYCRSCPRFR